MASNFEAKHPRARDGKFTEKLRAESGLELSSTPDDQRSVRDVKDLERGEIFVGKVESRHPGLVIGDVTKYEHERCEKIAPGQWWISQKREMEDGTTELTYCYSGGFITENFDENGYITQQVFMDDEFNRIQDADKWTEKNWNKDGVLIFRTRDFFPQVRNERTFKTISEAVDKAGGTLVIDEYFSDSGALDEKRTWFKQDGQLYFASAAYYEDGSIKSRDVSDFYYNACAPENTPNFVFYEDGKLTLAEYMVVRDGESVYHRTDGPAIFSRSAPEGEGERYFLEGIEYTKSEWAKKTGND